jgi:hypothetical protein
VDSPGMTVGFSAVLVDSPGKTLISFSALLMDSPGMTVGFSALLLDSPGMTVLLVSLPYL